MQNICMHAHTFIHTAIYSPIHKHVHTLIHTPHKLGTHEGGAERHANIFPTYVVGTRLQSL